jgi:hypothetical protein
MVGINSERACGHCRWADPRIFQTSSFQSRASVAPTWIVIDDVDARAEEAARVIEALADRAKRDGLEYPVRLLLLDRHGRFLDALHAGEVRRAYVEPTRFGTPLYLAPLAPQAREALARELIGPDRQQGVKDALAALDRMDPGRGRPLYLRLIAEAVSLGRDPAAAGRAELLRRRLSDAEHDRWAPAGVTDEDKRIAAFVTLMGGLPPAELAIAAKEKAPLPAGLEKAQLDRVATVLDQAHATMFMSRMQPDLLGELFVLDLLALERGLSPERARALLDAGWKMRPDHMFSFFRRALEDWSGDLDPTIVLSPPPAGHRGPWAQLRRSRWF